MAKNSTQAEIARAQIREEYGIELARIRHEGF